MKKAPGKPGAFFLRMKLSMSSSRAPVRSEIAIFFRINREIYDVSVSGEPLYVRH
jgi:hypothetical protein